jgi:hypothetical protein
MSMYSQSHKTTTNVHEDIYCVMHDQPERQSNLKLGNDISSIHKRFGYFIDIKQGQSAVKSCELCSTSILLEENLSEKLTQK